MSLDKRIDVLALPKGEKIKCEVCRKTAVIRCKKCNVTYYCRAEHQKDDWFSLHQFICQELASIRGPQPFPVLEAEREELRRQLRKRKLKILELAHSIAAQLLVKEKCKLAIPPAMQALCLSRELFSKTSIEVIQPYIMLAEANIGINYVNAAFEFLCQAEWMVQKQEKVEHSVLAYMYKIWGRYYMEINDWLAALYVFAEHVYYMAKKWGTEDTRFANSYYYLGKALFNTDNIDGSIAAFQMMASIWQKIILKFYSLNQSNKQDDKGSDETTSRVEEEFDFSSVQVQEAVKLFKLLITMFKARDPDLSTEKLLVSCYHVTAFLIGNSERKLAKDYCHEAVYIYTERSRGIVSEDVMEHIEAILNQTKQF